MSVPIDSERHLLCKVASTNNHTHLSSVGPHCLTPYVLIQNPQDEFKGLMRKAYIAADGQFDFLEQRRMRRQMYQHCEEKVFLMAVPHIEVLLL